MKKILLVAVWAICLLNMLFFTDIIINYIIGNSQAFLSKASTGLSQMILASVMDLACVMLLYLYTIILNEKERV